MKAKITVEKNQNTVWNIYIKTSLTPWYDFIFIADM